MFDDVPLYWDAWDVMDYHLQTGYPSSLLNLCTAVHIAAFACADMKIRHLTAETTPQEAGAGGAPACQRGVLQWAPRYR